MWRRTYVLLTLIRLYFAVCPSYLHPDEHFQGPEVIAGRVFNHAIHQTWEFSSASPIRSMFSLWPVYGLPMLLFRSICGPDVSPQIVFTALRVVMCGLSFVLEDWALYELVPSKQQRRSAILLVASSYVTWTWQVHTFSNAIETILVLWSLVLIKRVEDKMTLAKSPLLTPSLLAVLLVFGTFNRITFPAFVALPLIRMAPRIVQRPISLAVLLIASAVIGVVAVLVDTAFYNEATASIASLLRSPIVTPLNSLLYNSDAANLALHGTHPFYQHFLVNLPQLLGPAYILLLTGHFRLDGPAISATVGTLVLSCFSHQEARFMLPVVPVLLSALTVPPRFTHLFVVSWVIFNAVLGVLMGIYHQGGVVPAQIHLGTQSNTTQAFWWKTYSPPTWVLGQRTVDVQIVDLMGLSKDQLQSRICVAADDGTVLVAPWSATFLDRFASGPDHDDVADMRLEEVWRYSQHLNLDDMDFGDDGFLPTVRRVVGRRGLVVWKVSCPPARQPYVAAAMHRDW